MTENNPERLGMCFYYLENKEQYENLIRTKGVNNNCRYEDRPREAPHFPCVAEYIPYFPTFRLSTMPTNSFIREYSELVSRVEEVRQRSEYGK